MKKFSVLIVGLFLTVGVFAQVTKAEAVKKAANTVKEEVSGPKLVLESNEINYGTIEKNADPYRHVKITNVGTEPLVIKSAKGNCGCTVPTYPKEPIMPGESSEIKVRYATNRIGAFHKQVTLTTNETGNNRHIIKVVGKVLKPETTESVPESKGGFSMDKKKAPVKKAQSRKISPKKISPKKVMSKKNKG